MKVAKRFSAVIIMVMILIQATSAVFAVQNNLVANAGFEESDTSRWLAEGCVLERTDREAHTGAHSMKVSGRTLFYQSPRYPLQVQNNVTYVFTMWIKVPENAQTATFVMLAEPNFVTIGERVTAKAGEWTQLSGEYVHYGVAGESSEIYLRVSSQDSFVTETYYTDDWSVAKSEPSPAGICGESFIRIPDNGEKSVSYEARVTNQIGKRMPNISTQWSLIGRDGSAETPDVSITQNGRLTLSNETLPQQLTIRADSYVDGECVTQYQNVNVGVSRAYEALLHLSGISANGLNAVSENLTLPAEGAFGTSVKWKSKNPDVITDDGKVTRQEQDTEVILEVTVSDDFGSVTEEIKACVLGWEHNLLTNGGFEESFSEDDWKAENCQMRLEAEVSHKGGFSMRVYDRTEHTSTLRHPVTVRNNVEYDVSMWVKIPENAAPACFTMLTDTDWTMVQPMNIPVSGSEWTKLEGTYLHAGPEGEKSEVHLRVSQTSGERLEYYFTDDWYMGERSGSMQIAESALYVGREEHEEGILKADFTQTGYITARTLVKAGQTGESLSDYLAVYKNGELKHIQKKDIALNKNSEINIENSIYCDNPDLTVKHILLNEELMPLKEADVIKPAYYVSKQGSADGDGSYAAPFQTISRAAQVMQAGDTCCIREGVYREAVTVTNSGTRESPITFRPYRDEAVTVSGAESLTAEWQTYQEGIICADYPETIEQLFVDGSAYHIARWPNSDVDDLLSEDGYAETIGGDYAWVTCNGLPTVDFAGSRLYIWPGQAWNGRSRIVESVEGNQINFTEPFPVQSNGLDPGDPWKPQEGNKFYLYDQLSLLDTCGEWFYDDELRKLYLWTDSWIDPAELEMEYKARDWAFDIRDQNYIHIKNMAVTQAAIRIENGNGCVLSGLKITYPSDDNQKSVWVNGVNNAVLNTYIAYTPGDGIRLTGSGNIVDNCIIHDVNTCGDHFAAVQTEGSGNVITNNSFFRAGRSLILHYYSQGLTIAYNDLYEGGKLSKDLGATYTWGDNDGEGSKGSVIAYNWVHDMGNETGIYLDSFSMDYLVHHNVVYNVQTAFVLNGGALRDMVYNNTIINASTGFFTCTFPGYTLTQAGTEVKNNIVTGRLMFAEGEFAPDVSNNVEALVDENFLPGDTAIDKGVHKPGITDGFVGVAPDIGAYEFGGVYWRPGSDLTVKGK